MAPLAVLGWGRCRIIAIVWALVIQNNDLELFQRYFTTASSFSPTNHTIMAPSVMIDPTSDVATPSSAPPKNSSATRTLLLAPPSVAAHPESLDRIFEAHDRAATDIQMLDRLALGLVSLPQSTYDLILLLTDTDGSRTESGRLLDRNVMGKLVPALKDGGRFKSQDGSFASAPGPEQTEGILAGLVQDGGDGLIKPATQAGPQTVKLNFGRKKANAAAVPANGVEAANTGATNETKRALVEEPKAPAGVGFVDFSDDFEAGYDEEEDDYIPTREELLADGQIDPDTLLTEEDRQKPVIIRKSGTMADARQSVD